MGTTTRAVCSLFGSKDGLAAAVAQTAFGYVCNENRSSTVTDDPAADLIAIGTKVVRRVTMPRLLTVTAVLTWRQS